ncbi:MAG: V-type ATP synthase subunit F [Hydrogeniiclostridium sp.]
MYKIAVLGDRDSIYGFAALGLSIFPAENGAEGARMFRRLSEQEGEDRYAVIYITEALAAELSEEIEKCRGRKFPAVIPIPGVSGNTGAGMLAVKRSVEQAVGSDIIFSEKK